MKAIVFQFKVMVASPRTHYHYTRLEIEKLISFILNVCPFCDFYKFTFTAVEEFILSSLPLGFLI